MQFDGFLSVLEQKQLEIMRFTNGAPLLRPYKDGEPIEY